MNFKFFQKKPEPKPKIFENKGLAQAQKLGWITKGEFLGVSLDRAEKKYKLYLADEKAEEKAEAKIKAKLKK